jgi:glycosyltransferase involved in cell wall biosynthesis
MEHSVSSTNKCALLFVSSDKFPPHRADVSILFGSEMVKRGYQIDWLLQSNESCDKSYETDWAGGHAWVGKTNNGKTRSQRLIKNWLSVLHDIHLIKLCEINDYCAVQVKDKFIAALFAIFACRNKRQKFVFWLSYPFPEESLYAARSGTARYPLIYYVRGVVQKFLLYKIILPRAHYVFVQSEKMLEDIEKKGINRDKMMPVPMGVSLEQLPAVLPDWQSPLTPTVTYVGTLIGLRKMDFLIRAFSFTLRKIPKARLIMVGSGDNDSDLELLRQEAQRLGIEEFVEFTGHLPQAKAFEYIANSNVCVSPYYPTPILNSTSPTKLVEYMALGKAVVANEHPEQKAIIQDSRAGFCVPWDEKKFGDAIATILLDKDMAKQMGRRGRAFVENCRSYAKIVELVDAKYSEMCL